MVGLVVEVVESPIVRQALGRAASRTGPTTEPTLNGKIVNRHHNQRRFFEKLNTEERSKVWGKEKHYLVVSTTLLLSPLSSEGHASNRPTVNLASRGH